MWLEEEYKNYIQNPGEEISRETPVWMTEEVTDVLRYRKDSFFKCEVKIRKRTSSGWCEYASFVFRRVEQTCFEIAIFY
jgi:hypothetical protein